VLVATKCFQKTPGQATTFYLIQYQTIDCAETLYYFQYCQMVVTKIC